MTEVLHFCGSLVSNPQQLARCALAVSREEKEAAGQAELGDYDLALPNSLLGTGWTAFGSLMPGVYMSAAASASAFYGSGRTVPASPSLHYRTPTSVLRTPDRGMTAHRVRFGDVPSPGKDDKAGAALGAGPVGMSFTEFIRSRSTVDVRAMSGLIATPIARAATGVAKTPMATGIAGAVADKSSGHARSPSFRSFLLRTPTAGASAFDADLQSSPSQRGSGVSGGSPTAGAVDSGPVIPFDEHVYEVHTCELMLWMVAELCSDLNGCHVVSGECSSRSASS